MSPVSSGLRTTGAAHFDPDELFNQWAKEPSTLPQSDDLRSSIISTFNLSQNDNFVYHAIASVTLAQVQDAISHGGEKGLHAWYRDEEGTPVCESVPSSIHPVFTSCNLPPSSIHVLPKEIIRNPLTQKMI